MPPLYGTTLISNNKDAKKNNTTKKGKFTSGLKGTTSKQKTFKRKKSNWKSTRQAWQDVAKKTGIHHSQVKSKHTATYYVWNVIPGLKAPRKATGKTLAECQKLLPGFEIVKKKSKAASGKKDFVVTIPIDSIFYDFDDDEIDQDKVKSLIKSGTKNIAPLKVWQNKTDNKVYLLEGGEKLEAFIKLNEENVPVVFSKTAPKNIAGLKAPTSLNKETTTFNKQILQAKRNGINPRKVFTLGKTKGILKKYLGDNSMTISGEAIKKAMDKDDDHIATFEHFINLPDSINNPIAIFKSKTKNEAFVVLTEIKTYKEKPLMVALHINNSFKIGKIASVYNRKRTNDYRKWKKEDLAIYVNKKPFDALLSGTIPVSQTTKGQSKDTKNSKTTKKLESSSEINKVVSTTKEVGLNAQIPFFKSRKEAKKFFLNWARKHLKAKSIITPNLTKTFYSA